MLTKRHTYWIVLLALGAIIFLSWRQFFTSHEATRQPLYWVAPMDPDYRRDAPGKSPMGMDLIPVYEEDAPANTEAGVVKITPQVQNQLGVRTQEVKRKALKLHLRTYGRVNFDRNLVVKLSPRVTGWVDMLFASTEGEAVKRGQPLFALYSPELIRTQEEYLAALTQNNQTNIRKAESGLRALKMDDAAIDQLKTERVAQQSVIFRAPKDGVVGMLNVTEGDYVEPGDPLMAIGSLENVWVEMDIFESQASLIKPRQLISLTTPSYPSLTWEGEVDYIYPALSSREQSLRFRSEIDNPQMRLKPNMHIQGVIALADREAAIVVPRQAVIDLGEQQRVVLELGSGSFKSVEVTVGHSNANEIEVLQGLEEGDRIVTSAHFLIDSESSKKSDFQRMLQPAAEAQSKYPPTWVKATIKEVALQERQLRLQHEYIDAWKMPGMTMNFQASDELRIHDLKPGDRVTVKVTDGDPLFQVIDVKRLGDQQ